MKKLIILFIALSTILTSCSSDDSSTDISGDILGTWVGVDVDYSGSTSATLLGENISADFVGEAYDVDYTITFSENPNLLVSEGGYSLELTTTIDGETEIENIEDIEFANGVTWSKSGNRLTTTEDGETIVYTIVELTDTRLELKASEMEDITEEGITFTTEIDLVATFVRQ